jgi:hypothetical protein
MILQKDTIIIENWHIRIRSRHSQAPQPLRNCDGPDVSLLERQYQRLLNMFLCDLNLDLDLKPKQDLNEALELKLYTVLICLGLCY